MKLKLILSLIALFVGADIATATVSTSGALLEETTVQSSYAIGARESDTAIRWFQEVGGITLGANVSVDITTPGTYGSTLSAGTVAAGTNEVRSYLVHMDAVGTPFPVVQLTGTFTFSGEKVRGIIVTSTNLNAVDASLGHPSVTTWFTGPSRGMEIGVDTVVLSANFKTVTVTFRVGSGIDQIRILTTPEPSSLLLLGLGLTALGYGGHRRRKSRSKAA